VTRLLGDNRRRLDLPRDARTVRDAIRAVARRDSKTVWTWSTGPDPSHVARARGRLSFDYVVLPGLRSCERIIGRAVAVPAPFDAPSE
jgi:hypothetical protein